MVSEQPSEQPSIERQIQTLIESAGDGTNADLAAENDRDRPEVLPRRAPTGAMPNWSIPPSKNCGIPCESSPTTRTATRCPSLALPAPAETPTIAWRLSSLDDDGRRNWMVYTGAGPGIMRAATKALPATRSASTSGSLSKQLPTSTYPTTSFQLQVLLHSQAHVRQRISRLCAVPRRVRHHGRGIRGADT